MNFATLFTISGILIVVVYLPVLYFVLVKGRTKTAKLFSLHILCVIYWGISTILIGLNRNPEIVLKIWNLCNIGVAFIPVTFLHVVHLMLKQRTKLLLYFAYAQAIFFLFISINEKLIETYNLMFGSLYYGQAGPFSLPYFILWLFTIMVAHLKLIQHYKISYPHQKRQIFLLLLDIPIGFGGGSMNFLPLFGINIFPYGNFLVPIYGLILAYAILKHQLLDIKVVIKRSVVYYLLIAAISILYLLVVLTLEKLFQTIFGYQSLAISIITAFGLGLFFVPLRHRIQRLVDRYFFKGTSEEIVMLNEQLRQQIAQSDKYKTLGTLASGIAHEVKNPLTAIKTFTEYLPQKLEDKEFLTKFSKIVGREVERIDHLIHQLLNYAKPTPLSVKHINIHKLIGDTIDVLNNRFITQKIEVNQNFHNDQKLHLHVDPNQIRQALLNVLLNAVEAMPTGGSLVVETRIKGIKDSNHIFEISIRDTGNGILPEDLKHIFDPFFSKKDEGTGLGLSIVQGILENHQGKVRVESRVGVGTEVVLELPLNRENTQKSTQNNVK